MSKKITQRALLIALTALLAIPATLYLAATEATAQSYHGKTKRGKRHDSHSKRHRTKKHHHESRKRHHRVDRHRRHYAPYRRYHVRRHHHRHHVRIYPFFRVHRPHVRYRYYWHDSPETRVIIIDADDPEPRLPALDCPIRTEEIRSGLAHYCATSRGTRHGPYVRYFDSGRVAEEGQYAYGQKDGVWTFWHDNGQPRMEGEFDDGERIGTWVTWNRKGEELSVESYPH